MVFGGMMLSSDGSTGVPTFGTQTNYVSSATALSYTVSAAVDADANFLAVVFGWGRNSFVDVPSATYNSVAMTRSAYTSDSVLTIYSGAGVFTLQNPATGTHNFVVTFPSNVDTFACRVLSIKDAAASSPVNQTGTANGGGGNAGSLSLALLTSKPNLIVCAMTESRISSGTPTWTADAGTTQLFAGQATGGATSSHFFGTRSDLTSGSYSVGASCSQARTATLAAIAIAGA